MKLRAVISALIDRFASFVDDGDKQIKCPRPGCGQILTLRPHRLDGPTVSDMIFSGDVGFMGFGPSVPTVFFCPTDGIISDSEILSWGRCEGIVLNAILEASTNGFDGDDIIVNKEQIRREDDVAQILGIPSNWFALSHPAFISFICRLEDQLGSPILDPEAEKIRTVDDAIKYIFEHSDQSAKVI